MTTDNEFKDKWVAIEWFDEELREDSVSNVHVFDSERDAKEFKKHRADFPNFTSIHKAQTGN